MHQYEPNFMADSDHEMIDEPVTPAKVENVLRKDIYYNEHIIPSGATFEVQE